MLKRFQTITIILGLSILLAIPLYFAGVWAAQSIDLQKPALSMYEAYQLALQQAERWDESVRLLTITSVDLDKSPQYDGATGLLPHWNVDFVAANNRLYHVEIRNGRVIGGTEQGTALYSESLSRNSTEVIVDSPSIAQLAVSNGLHPYAGKWARGLNFILTVVDNEPQIVVRGATQSGNPAFFTFDAHGGNLLAAAERTVSGGGIFLFQHTPATVAPEYAVENDFHKILPQPGDVPDNIAAIAIVPLSPANQKTIYAGTDTRRDFLFAEAAQLLLSYDSGITWHSLTTPFGEADAVLHIETTPDGATVFVGTTEGLFYAVGDSMEPDITWQIPIHGLPTGHITSLALSPQFSEDQTILAAVGTPATERSLWARPGSEGLFRSLDGGQSWEKMSSAPAGVTDIALSPNFSLNTTIFVTANNTGVFKSADGGQTWSRLPLEQPGFGQLAISPDFPVDQTLFVATGNGLWRSEDAGTNWRLLTSNMAYPTNAAIHVQVSPTYSRDRTVVYGAFRGGLVISRDGGETWQQFNLMNLSGDPTPRTIEFLEEGNIILSTFPLLGWTSHHERLDDAGEPYSYPTPHPNS